MNEQEALAKLADIINEIQGVDQADVTVEKSLVDDLEIDSLAMVEISVAIEDQLGVAIPDDDLKTIVTVGDAVNYITSHS